MKKTYIAPELTMVMVTAPQLLAGSTTIPFKDETVDDITFSAREEGFDFGEEDIAVFEEAF